MQRYLLLIIFSCVVRLIQGQNYLPEGAFVTVPDSAKICFISGGARWESTSFTNRLVVTLLSGNQIGQDFKYELIKRSRAINRIGYDFNVETGAGWKLDSCRSVFITLGQADRLYAQMSNEVLKLVLYGNSLYAGQGIALDNTDYRRLMYNYISFQFQKRYTKWTYHTGLDFLALQGFTQLQIQSGNLYTEQNGEYINLRLKGDLMHSPYQSVPSLNHSGLGLAFRYEMKGNYKKLFWKAGFKDLGFIYKNTAYTNYTSDTTIHYEGVTVNISDLIHNSNAFNNISDSLKKWPDQFKKDASRYIFVSPEIYIGASTNRFDGIWGIMLQYRPEYTRMPRLILQYIHIYKRKHQIHYNWYAGGNTSMDVGMGYTYRKDKHHFYVYSTGLKGILAPRLFMGGAIFSGYSFHW